MQERINKRERERERERIITFFWKRERERERENNHIFLEENVRQIIKLYKRRWVEEYSKENV